MPVIEGRIEPRVETAALLEAWNNRYAHEIAPTADLRTDGGKFTITHSSSWDVQSLKHSIELEVHRVNPGAAVHWSQTTQSLEPRIIDATPSS
jgi:hypothetical protein